MKENLMPAQRVLIIDDHPLFRKGLKQLIQDAEDFQIVGEASDGKEGITRALALRPDIILLDLNMKDMSGIDVLKVLKPADIDARIIMLTVSDHAEDLVAALRAGADGYLLKDMEPEDLLDNIRAAGLGQMRLTDKLTSMLVRSLGADKSPASPSEAGLTEQEERILELIATGKSNKLIAHELGITEGTVKVHVKHVLKKLNLKSRVEAAVWSIGKTNKVSLTS
jgi:two-component system, NarL family, nitrate/nitrite response regulator NarL